MKTPSRTSSFSKHFLGRLSSWLVLSTVLTVAAPPAAQAADAYWDADLDASNNLLDGTGLGGTGIWNNIFANWWDGAFMNNAWAGAADTAIFRGTAGTVTLGEPVAAAGLTFNTSGYLVTGNTLTLSGATPTIHVTEGIVTITSALAGTDGFTKTGDGTLILRGTNTYTGVTTLNGGMTLLATVANTSASVSSLGAIGVGNGTVVNSGATLAYGPDSNGASPIDNPAELITINGQGYGNNGALRSFMGANGSNVTGVVTMAGASRIQSDQAGTFTLSGAFDVNHTLTTGGVGTVSLTGAVTGSGDINHYGLGMFRMTNTTVGHTYSGTINSTLGEIRGDTGNADATLNPYAEITALNLKNSLLRLMFGNTAGGPTDVADSRFSTTAPISMRASAINLDNASISSTSTNLFNYAVAQTLGATTLNGGFNRIGFRSANTGSVTLRFADIQKPNAGTALEFHVDTLTGAALGTSAKHQILNTALETGGVNIPFIGGWAYSAGGTANPEFVKYVTTGNGGFGYTPLVAGDYAVDTAVGTWTAGQNIKLSAGGANITANTTIQSLNIQNATARTLSGNAGTTLVVGSGGIITSGSTAHTISVPFLTAGAASNYELYNIAWSTNIITSDVTDNGGNPVSLVKLGTGTTSFLTGNSYTGTTFINEGQFRGVIGSQATALGSGNLTFGGSPNSQATFETDDDFSRELGTGAGQVQLLGGGGAGGGSAGFSAFGAPVKVNFGGAGATVVWGSSTFDPGIFTLNGGNATHVLTLVNGLDLGGEQRYIRLDGGSSASERGVIGRIAGDITNGSIVKRGGGLLLVDSAKSYQNGTIINQGTVWLRGAGTAGANVAGNDIQIAPDATLKIDSPSNIGSQQMIILQNNSNDTPAVITFGAGYGTGSEIVFNSLHSTGGVLKTGGNNILIANNQSGQARRVAVTISGLNDFQNDVPGQIFAAAPNVEAWFGADTGNGVFTGTTLTASGGAVRAFRLGGHTNNGGVLTIAKANVLTGAFPLIVGAPDQTDRNYTDGTIYIPQVQSFTGQITIGQGGILQAGVNGSLGTGGGLNDTILLRAGELRLDAAKGTFGGQTGTQYSARNLNIAGATGTIRTTSLLGAGFNGLQVNDLTFDANRQLNVLTLGTNFTDLVVNNINFANSANTITLAIGVDNSFQAGAGMMTVNGVIGDQVTGLQSLTKTLGGVLILNGANTYDGGTTINQGRVVLGHTSGAGTGAITLATNSDRRSDIEYRVNGTGPFLFNNAVITSGGNDNSTRIITVGAASAGSEDQTVRIASLTIGHTGAYTAGGAASSALFFDGANGYRIEVVGATTLNRSIALRTRGALVTLTGVVSGAAANTLEKNDQGTLVLNGNNTYLGTTLISNGYVIAGHNNAFGAATSDITFRGTAFSQVLAAGERTITRSFNNTATGSVQTLGGLDAGAKLFSGNVNITTRGVALTAITGGDVTFSGVISGASGVEKQGNGNVILSNANTYAGGTTISQGTLIGIAQAAGSPFGTGPITVNDGVLQLNGIAASTTTTAGALTVGGGARVVVQDEALGGNSTTLTFASLNRTGTGTVTFVPSLGALNTDEIITFTTAPTLVNTIIGPWAVRATSGTNNAADYVSLSGNNLVTATYGGSGDLDNAAGSTQVFNAGATGGTLTADRSVFAFRTDANVNLAGFTLNVGDNATPINGGGIILNNGADITGAAGSEINIGNTALSIYVDDAAVSSLNVPIRNTRNNASNTQTVALIKFGAGTLEIGAVQNFEGHIELNRGTISFTAPNVLPMFTNLNARTGSIVIMSPGTTINLNNHNQEFGNLAAANPSNSFQFSAGTLNLGTATLTVGRENSNQLFNGQITGGAGSRLVKIGDGTLTLDNINGNKPNSLETLEVVRGTLAAWMNDNSWATPETNVSAIPSTTTILLRGGQFTALAIGDSTGNQQRIHLGNNVVHQGADTIFRTDRATGGGSNKLVVFNDLTLDVQRFLTNGANNFIPRFDGTTTLTNHARIQTDNQLVLAGAISDGGKGFTLNKIGGSDLSIGGDSSGTWSGGTVITGGLLIFGSRGTDDIRTPGITLVNLATANAGTGDIIVNQGSSIRIAAPSNILTAQGQEVRVYGSERGSTTRVDLLTDAALTDYNLRSLTDGSVALGMSEGFWTTAIDLAKMGSGQWGISALSNTFYTAATLGTSIDNRYLFTGSAAGVLSIVNSNVITGTASVELGKSPVFPGATPAGAGASVRFYGDQDYTGNTTIFRQADAGSIGAILEITGDIASPVIDVYGRLTVRGDGRLTNDAGAQVNTVNLRPGSNLRLDYNMDVNDNFIVSRLDNSNLGLETDENKWGDNTPLLLDGAAINLVSSNNRVNQETVGAITIRGGAGITLERTGSGQMVLNTPSITRTGQSTLAIRNTTVAELGSINIQSQKLFLSGAAPTLTNGMVAPWMFNASGQNFLSYNTTTGFTNADFVPGAPTAGAGDAYLSSVGSTDIVRFQGGWGDTTLTGTKNVYALRVDAEASGNSMDINGGQINIHSGGLLTDSNGTGRVNFNTTNIFFGDGATAVEGIVHNDESGTQTRFGGVVTAANLTLVGPGGYQLTNAANAISGTIQMNGGTLFVDGNGARGTASEIILHSDYSNNFNGGQMSSLRLRHNSATTTYTGLTVTVGANVPYAQIQAERFSGTGTTTAVEFQALNILGTDGPAGTLVQLFNSNSNTNVLGTTTIGGTSAVGLNVNANTWRLIGNVTSAAPIVKTGGGVLRWDGAQSGFTGGFTLNAGEWRLNGTGADIGGTGDVELNFGTVRMASAAANTSYFTTANQDISVNGQVTFIVDRDGGSVGTTRTIGVNGSPSSNVFRTTNSPYIIFQAVSFGDDIIMESQVEINGSPVFRVDSVDLFLRGLVSGSGTFNKAGINYLHFDNNAANTFTGGFNNFTGVTIMRQVNATLGTGPVQVFAGTGLSIASTAQLGTTGLTKILTSGTALPTIGTRTIANFNAITAAVAAPGVLSGTGNGVLAIDNGQTLAVDPLMATRDGGVFNLWNIGSQDGNGTLNANSITPWGVGGAEFRIGGGGVTLTVNPVTPNSDQFGGVGNRMILGVAGAVQGWGLVTIGSNANNSYGGGTLVTRSRNRDGGFRGVSLSVLGGAIGTTTDFRTPLGSGQVDVFGDFRFEGASGTAVGTGGLTNSNTYALHPGSRIRFDNSTPFTGSGTLGNRATGTLGGGGRWADAQGITLNSSVLEMFGDGTDHIANREIIGDLTIQGGSEVVIRRVTGFWSELSAGNIARSGAGTLQITTMTGTSGQTNTAGILGTVASNVDSSLFLAANGASLMNNNMVNPWITSRMDNNFLKYDDTLGFQVITQGSAPSNYLTSTGGSLNAATLPLNNGTEILNLTTANGTLALNPDVYALRTDRTISNSADNAFDRITIRSGGLIVGSNQTTTLHPDLYFGSAGDGTGEALLWVNTGTLEINGQIFASQVVKAGTNTLNIRSDQTEFTGNWIVNGGTLQFLTPNAQSTGEVILNGARMNDRDSTFALTALQYNFNAGTPDLFTWGGGKITVNGLGLIRSVAASDRLDQIPAIDLKTSGGGHEGTVFFQSDASRHTIRTGTVTLFDHYMLSVDAFSFGPGSTSGVQLGAGDGTGGLNNQGLYDVRLTGDGVLSLGNNSASFTGGRTFSVGDGTVRVLHNGAFGDASITANLRSTGVMEIATSNFAPLATVVQEVGSIERWAVSDARGPGNYTLPNGVHLQVFTDIMGTRTIDLSGGSIMGYLPLDYDQVAVIQTIRSGVTVNLTADSFLGQIYPAGTSNGTNHIFYDMGKLNTTTNLNPSDVGLRGSYLVIDGNITGAFDLTKLGQDVIKLAGANSFGDLSIEGGIIQIGRTNALAASTVVSTRGEGSSGILDLNGYDQEIAGLEGPSGTVNNSAFDRNTLTIDNAVDHTYAGAVNGSINLTKQGVAVQHLTADNNYGGVTTVEGGELHVSLSGTLSRTEVANVEVNGLLRVDGSIHGGAIVDVEGVLRGTGTVGTVNVQAGGEVNPGNGLGTGATLNTGDFNLLTATSKLSIEINMAAPATPTVGTHYNQVSVTGSTLLGGDLVLTISNGTGITENDLFFIALNDGFDANGGTFATVNGLAYSPSAFDVGGQLWALSTTGNWTGNYATSTFDGGNDVVLMAVPEPSSLAMLAGSLGLALGLQRFRRRRLS